MQHDKTFRDPIVAGNSMCASWNVLFGILAVQQALLDEEHLALLGAELASTPDLSVAEFAVDVGWLTVAQSEQVAKEVTNLLPQNRNRETGSTAKPAPSHQKVVDEDTSQDHLLPPPPKPIGTRYDSGFLQKNPSIPSVASSQEKYQRLRIHGQGGIGTVWVAQDKVLKRTVAVKELRPEPATSAGAHRRFIREARITGQLEHPGIVPVYELAEDSQQASPFYVMRLLQGETLSKATARYHETRQNGTADKLAWTNLLQAFVAVCNTIGYAHSQGVIHRDLKGSNILLGEFGEVMVLDWGLAKQLSESRDELTAQSEPTPATQTRTDSQTQPNSVSESSQDALAQLTEIVGDFVGVDEQTRQGTIMGSLAYMAPEQAAGDLDHINERTDIYGLGAILYELLTARAPFSLSQSGGARDEAAVSALLKRVQTEQPPRPRSVASDVPAALEAICLRATARAPEARYPSARALAEDVTRWLADEPVSVYRDPLSVRWSRWARRHRTLVTSGLLVFLMALIALGITTVLVNQERARTAEAATRARHNFAQAREAVDRFYVQVSETRLLNEPGLQLLRRELLDIARDYYETFLRDQKNSADLRMELIETQFQLAGVTSDLGDYAEARTHLLSAIEVLEDDRQSAQLPEKELLMLGKLQARLGTCAQFQKQQPKAIEYYTLATATLNQLPAETNSLEAQRLLGNVVGNLGLIYLQKAKQTAPAQQPWASKAKSALSQSLAIHQALAKKHPGDDRLLNDVAGSHTNLAQLFSITDREAAKTHLRQAVQIHKTLVKQHPASIEYRNNLGKGLNSLGVMYSQEGNPKAQPYLTEALTMRKQLARENPNLASVRQQLGDVYLNLGNDYYRRTLAASADEKPALRTEADEHLRLALDSYRQLKENYPEQTTYRVQTGTTLSSLGNVWYDADSTQALKWYEQAIAETQPLAKDRTPSYEVSKTLGISFWGLAELYSQDKQWSKALTAWLATADHWESFSDVARRQIRSGLERTLKNADQDGFLQTKEGSRILQQVLATSVFKQ